MLHHPVHIDQLAEEIQDAAKTYVQLLLHFYGDRLLGLTFHGAAVGEHCDLARDRARSVAVLEKIDLGVLRELARQCPNLNQMGLVAPVIMTPEYIRDSQDTLPLELLEIQVHNVTILGKDFFAELQFEDEHIRLECEHVLNALMMHLRQELLASAGHEALLGELRARHVETLQRSLRGFLWWQGRRVEAAECDPVDAAERYLQRPLPGIRNAITREGPLGWEPLEQLYSDLQVLRDRVDAG